MSAYSDLIIAHGASNYWRLGEPSGTTAVDVVGGKNGTISGGVTLGQPGAIADGNKAMTFNGTTGKIVTAANVTLGPLLSIECWARTTVAAGFATMGSKFPNATEDSLGFAIASANELQCFVTYANALSPNSNHVPTVATIVDGQWHHIVWVFPGGTTIDVFVDGVSYVVPPLNRALVGSTLGPWTIGTTNSLGTFFNGSIDDVAIYQRALTPAEITTHFKAATGGTRRPDLPFWTLVAGGNPVEQFNRWLPITPSDTVDLPEGPSDGIWVGGGGDVAAVMQDNTMPVVLAAVPAGAWLPIAARRIKATGTTATNLVVLYQL